MRKTGTSALVFLQPAGYQAFYVVINSSEMELEKLPGFHKMAV